MTLNPRFGVIERDRGEGKISTRAGGDVTCDTGDIHPGDPATTTGCTQFGDELFPGEPITQADISYVILRQLKSHLTSDRNS